MSDDNVTPLKTPATEQGAFEQTPAGVFLGRCYKMIDLGTQPASKVNGKLFKPARKIMLYWELLKDDKGQDVRMEDGERPFRISNEYTWSTWKTARLRQVLDSWRGVPFTDEEADGFEITKLLGVYCTIQVIHKVSGDKTYANIGAILPHEEVDEAINPISSFSIEKPDMAMFDNFPSWIQDKIRQAREWDVPTVDGHITPEGKVEIEELDDSGKPKPVSKEDLNPVKKPSF